MAGANILDIFKQDAFGIIQMTDSINTLPPVPTRLAGLFEEDYLTVTTAFLEFMDGVIYLVPSTERGGVGKKQPPQSRTAKSLKIPHFPVEDYLRADDLSGVRPWGGDASASPDPVTTAVNNKLQRMKDALELTREWLRMGAIKGVVIDGDGSTTLLDLFTEYGVVQKVVDFVLGTTTTDVKSKAMEVVDHITDALGGGLQYSQITALCGTTFWNKFINHPEVRDSFALSTDDRFRLENQTSAKTIVDFAGIKWERFYGKVGSSTFVPASDCRFVAEGVPDLFKGYFAPAPYNEAVNTIAQKDYAKQQEDKWGVGIEMRAETNVIYHCTRPKTLVRGTTSN